MAVTMAARSTKFGMKSIISPSEHDDRSQNTHHGEFGNGSQNKIFESNHHRVKCTV
jgi:hypothetical protein